MIAFLAASMVVVPPARVATLVLTTAVSDKLAATSLSHVEVTKIALAPVTTVASVVLQHRFAKDECTSHKVCTERLDAMRRFDRETRQDHAAEPGVPARNENDWSSGRHLCSRKARQVG